MFDMFFETCFAKGVFYLITIMNRLIIVENHLCYLEKYVNNRVGEGRIGESGIGETGTTKNLYADGSFLHAN